MGEKWTPIIILDVEEASHCVFLATFTDLTIAKQRLIYS